MYRKKQTGNECRCPIPEEAVGCKIDQVRINGVDDYVCQMITPRLQLPEGVIHKIGEGDDRPVRQFVGNNKIFLIKKCRKVPPLPNKIIVSYGKIIIIDKGISQRIQVN